MAHSYLLGQDVEHEDQIWAGGQVREEPGPHHYAESVGHTSYERRQESMDFYTDIYHFSSISNGSLKYHRDPFFSFSVLHAVITLGSQHQHLTILVHNPHNYLKNMVGLGKD